MLSSESFEDAKKKYAEASSIKSSEQYPKDKIKEIDDKLALLAAEQEEIRLRNEKEAALEAQYDGLIKEADDLLNQDKLKEAAEKYQAALAVRDEQYPKDQLAKIESLEAEKAEKEAADAAAAEKLSKKPHIRKKLLRQMLSSRIIS